MSPMRRRIAIVAFAGVTACNVITGASSLRAVDGDEPGDASSGGDGASSEGASRDGGSDAEALVDGEVMFTCSGSACFDAGVCDGAPCAVRIYAGGTGSVQAIAADQSGVYWTVPSAGRIHRLLNTATSPDVIYTSTDGIPSAVAALGSQLWWAERGIRGRVRRISSIAPAGSPPAATREYASPVETLAVGVGGAAVVWGNAQGQVTVASAALNTSSTSVSGQSPIVGVGVFATDPYWASSGTIDAIRSGASDAAIATADDLRSFAVDGQRLYWTTGTGGRVESSLHSGLDRLTLPNEGEPVAIASDGTAVYWVNIADGRVRSATTLLASPVTLASGQGRPRAIAVNDKAVYWVNDTRGEVWSLLK